MSAGYFSWISPELDNAPDRLLRFVEVFEATGIYLFTAAGNYYSNVNSSYVQDGNNSGWLNIGNEQYSYLQKFSVFKDRKFEVYVASNTWGIPDAEDLFFFPGHQPLKMKLAYMELLTDILELTPSFSLMSIKIMPMECNIILD